MKLKVFILAICIQCVVIVFLCFHIKSKKNNTLGVSVNPINSNAIQKVSSNDLRYFYEPKANTVEEVHKDWLLNTPKYTINNDTLNERFNYDVQKKQGTFRIITLGDSFTFGENVDTKDNYTEQLEDLLNSKCSLNKFEVINLVDEMMKSNKVCESNVNYIFKK